MPALSLARLVAAYLGAAVVGHGGVAQVAGWVLALAFGFAAGTVGVAAIYRLFAPRPLGERRIARGAVAAAGAISVVSPGYVLFLNSGVDSQRRYATSGLAAVVLLVLLAVHDQRPYSRRVSDFPENMSPLSGLFALSSTLSWLAFCVFG